MSAPPRATMDVNDTIDKTNNHAFKCCGVTCCGMTCTFEADAAQILADCTVAAVTTKACVQRGIGLLSTSFARPSYKKSH
jgi:hypothetical protein